MKKLLIGLMLCFLLVGCDKEINVEDPATQAVAKVAIALYIEKNQKSIPIILEANEIFQDQNYGFDTYTYSIVNYKNTYLRKAFVDKTPAEKVAILTLTDLIFDLANEEFKSQDFDLVEPEYLGFIKQLFENAAAVAILYEEVE